VRIVNTFISDGGPLPSYTEVSLRQARKTNPDVEIDFICKDDQELFSEVGVNWIPQESIQSSELDMFNEVCWFKRHGTPNTTFKSPNLFWHRTCERIYYLEAYISQQNMQNVFHFENDVLLYGHLSTVPVIDDVAMVLPMSRNKATFAFCHISEPNNLHSVCKYFTWLMSSYGETRLSQHLGDHVSEMSLLYMALREHIVAALPTLPTYGAQDGILTEQTNEMVFDPGSYGQFLGGTNNGHGAGFTDSQHFIGELIESGDLQVTFDGTPSVNGVQIFNLHIHGKNLEEFANV